LSLLKRKTASVFHGSMNPAGTGQLLQLP
jgi:hypothetical protein